MKICKKSLKVKISKNHDKYKNSQKFQKSHKNLKKNIKIFLNLKNLVNIFWSCLHLDDGKGKKVLYELACPFKFNRKRIPDTKLGSKTMGPGDILKKPKTAITKNVVLWLSNQLDLQKQCCM